MTSGIGVRLAICDSQSAAKSLFVKPYGQVGLEFKLRPFSAGSILTLRNRIEPLASTTSLERTPRKMKSTKLTPSITAPGKLAIHITCGLFVLLTFSRLTLRKASRARPWILRSCFKVETYLARPEGPRFNSHDRQVVGRDTEPRAVASGIRTQLGRRFSI